MKTVVEVRRVQGSCGEIGRQASRGWDWLDARRESPWDSGSCWRGGQSGNGTSPIGHEDREQGRGVLRAVAAGDTTRPVCSEHVLGTRHHGVSSAKMILQL